jgi:uncharacterized damage-inducible protein DinB
MAAVTPELAAQLRDILVEDMKGEHRTTLAVLRSCPEEHLDYAPHEKAMSFGKIAVHIYTTGPWFLGVITRKEPPTMAGEPPRRLPDLERLCRDFHDGYIQGIRALAPEQLARNVDFFGQGEYPAITLLRWNLHHLIHHRGQMQTYLRIMGARCPQIYGPTADDTAEASTL